MVSSGAPTHVAEPLNDGVNCSLQLFPALPPIMCFAQNCSLIDCMEYRLSLIEGVTLSALWPRMVSCILTLLGVDVTGM